MAEITTSAAGNMLDPTKWVGGVCPTELDTAIVGHAMTLTDGQSVQYLALRKSASGAITTTGNCSILNTPCTHDVGSSAVAIVTVSTGTFTGTGSTFTGGDASGERGISVNSGALVISCSCTGGSAYGAYGSANSGTCTSCSYTGGSVSGAYGMYNSGTCTSCSYTGGSVSGAYGMYNNGTCTSCSCTGGSVSGAYGIANFGVVDNLTAGSFTGTGTAKRGIHSPIGGLVIVDGANVHGDNYIHAGRLYLRGTLAADHALTGTYTLFPIPAASLVLAPTAYLDILGTYVAPVVAGYSAIAPGYGADGATTGTLAAIKIRDATYGTLADGSVLVAAGGTYIDPSDGDVKLGIALGVTPRAGTWDAVSKSAVVAGLWVVAGHDNYTGGSAGEYPTTATSQAAQHVVDRAAVSAAAASILNTATVIGVDGTLDPGLYITIPTPTGADPVLDLADLLVANLSSLAATLGTPGYPAFTAAWKSDPVADLAESSLLSPIVWVTDFAAAQQPAEASQHGVPVEEFELLVILQRKIGNTETADTVCRAMSELAAEIANGCRKMVLDPGVSGNGSICYKTDRARARDFKEWHEADLYRAEISTHWRRVYAGDE